MVQFKRFEDIPVWQAGRRLVKEIYRVTRYPEFASDFGLKNQIRRASVSITSNIAEGHERGTTRDLILFLYYAKGSAGEVRSQLYNAEDAGFLASEEAAELRDAASDISRQIYGWVTSMQAPDFDRGPSSHVSKSIGESRWEKIVEQLGMHRLPNGQFVKKSEMGLGEMTENGRTEDGTTENGRRKNG